MTGFSTIPLAEEGGEREDSHLAGIAKILGPRWAQLPAITVGLLGVQVFWSVEMSYGTPYLLSLGLSKAAVAMVFLAGPISGLLVQPLIGVLADKSKSRFGRRRPYMVTGCIICITAMMLLGFTRPFATLFLPAKSVANDLLTIWLAIIALFTIDFSINAVQAVDRALIIDTLPSAEQADANAWAARMLGFGSVAGYFIGNVDMTTVFPFFGDTELEVLAVVGSMLLLLTHAITAFCTKEKVVVSTKRLNKSFARELKEIWQNAFTLPPVIRQICMIQFFSWVGWFPVLFYTSAFIGDLHKQASTLPPDDPGLDAESTRLGTRALFYSSLLSFAGNVLLPFVVAESARSRRLVERKLAQAHKSAWVRTYDRVKVHLTSLWAAGHLLFAICMFATFFYSSVAGATFFTTLTGFSWSITQWAPFSLLAEAILTEQTPGEDGGSILLNDTRTRRSGSLHLGGDDHERQFLVGEDEEDEETPAPLLRKHDIDARTLSLEEDVRSFSSNASMDSTSSSGSVDSDGRPKPHKRSHSSSARHSGDGIHDGGDDEPRAGLGLGLLQNANARMSHMDVHSMAMSDSSTLHPDVDDDDGHEGGSKRGGLAAKAGIILGIHNVFIVIPQFIMTGFASIIFALLDPSKSPSSGPELAVNGTSVEVEGARAAEALVSGGGPNSYGIVFKVGGLSATVAFVLTLRLARELRHH
ncbi:MFS general substrate transporter [Lentinus brumalis]|uniref:MFS general substrate transporter n=1 Tax=Lentinus brumalis TaxID=2498619 RepID=A0A371CZB8_9APHY|nr:MFS general substrate transporter [Polyporus brumalis]